MKIHIITVECKKLILIKIIYYQYPELVTLLISIVLGVEMDSSNVKNIWNNWSETWYQKNSNLENKELDKLCDWQLNPLAALPQWLSIKAAKHT